jgi:hypothetical protein
MPHKTRPRHLRDVRAGRQNRTRYTGVDTTRNERTYNVIFVWGVHDMSTRRIAVYDKNKAMRAAKGLAAKGAQDRAGQEGRPSTARS